jgi:hypothetical protein
VKRTLTTFLLTLLLTSTVQAAGIVVENTSMYADTRLGITVVSGTVELPAAGLWPGDLSSRGGALEQVVLIPETGEEIRVQGRRAQLAARMKNSRRGRDFIQKVWIPCLQYAQEHDGLGPGTLADFPENQKYVRDSISKSPWSEDRKSGQEGPFLFLMPRVPIPVPQGDRPELMPLALELRPYLDDGRHWVLLNNGSVEQRPIDQGLLDRYGLKISPVMKGEVEVETGPVVRFHQILALVRDSAAAKVKLDLTDVLTGDEVKVTWKLSGARAGDSQIVTSWASARLRSLGPYLRTFDAGILRHWLAATRSAYGLRDFKDLGPWMERRGGRMTSTFSILGGRAAVRETLQLQAIGEAGRGGRLGTIPISGIEGVDAPPHPFDEMLGKTKVKTVELAELAPVDRLFVYFSQPKALDAFLEKGTDFLFRSGSMFTSRSIVYDLKPRYYRKLGVSEKWIRKFLDSGTVKEMAVITPDLHFIDGTDITVICRVPRIKRFAGLLKLIGILDLREGVITEQAAPGGNKAFWTRRGKLVFAGTSREELKKILMLLDSGGVGSLGRSAEFKYMLKKLPLQKSTRTYVYFSDPFIRRLTGPQLKIGQARRMTVRKAMEAATAGAMLRQFDTGQAGSDVESLAELGYVPRDLPQNGFTLSDDQVARSVSWGTLGNMNSLLEKPVTMVTHEEEKAYRQYVDNYNRFWRRFFDPIALRLDDTPDGALELSTFILPLVENTIYQSVREVLESADSGGRLRVPKLAGDTVVSLSLNLKEEFWVKMAGRFGRELTGLVALDPSIYDLMGPGLHVAVMDGDPIIAMGSGDVMGAFGSQVVTGRGGFGVGIPLLLSVLTRPTRILVDVSDEKEVLDILNRTGVPLEVSGRNVRRRNTAFRKINGKDAWIYTFDLEGIISIRFGLEVRDGFLIISNLPWSYPLEFTEVEETRLSGAHMRVRPSAAEVQLPALYTSAAESYQKASLQGMAYLYPLLLTATDRPQEAAALQKKLFGFVPVHPPGGKWTYKNGNLESTAFGSGYKWMVPPYTRGDRDFGLLKNVDELELNVQMEEDGLRSTVRWSWKGE